MTVHPLELEYSCLLSLFLSLSCPSTHDWNDKKGKTNECVSVQPSVSMKFEIKSSLVDTKFFYYPEDICVINLL